MAFKYQFPYVKIIRDNGEIVPNSDHNKQEDQIECLTDAVGNYQFVSGSIEDRLQDLESTSAIGDPRDLDDLDDVDVPTPTIGNVLTFAGPTAGWIDSPPSASAVGDLDDLGDVATVGAVSGDTLGFNGADWVPVNRQVSVYSDLPGSPGEQTALNIDEIRFVTQAGIGEDHFVTLIGNAAYIGGGSPPAPLNGDIGGLGALVTGRMSQSNVNYPTALINGDIYNRITQTNAFTFDPPLAGFGLASFGNLILNINGIDVANIDLAANFVELNRATGQNTAAYNTQGTGDVIVAGVVSFVGGSLMIVSVDPDILTADEFQLGVAQIVVTATALRIGYNFLRLSHNVGTAVHQTNLLEWFYDTDPAGGGTDPSVSAASLAEDVPVLKHLSGISYYDTGSTFDLGITSLRTFNNVYHQSEAPLSVVTTWDGSPTINIADGSVSGLSTPPDIAETMTVTGFSLTVNPGIQNNDAIADATPRDPYASYGTVSTGNNNFVIMSNGPNSTEIFDDFTDERFRLPNIIDFDVIVPFGTGFPNLFDSTVSLLTGPRANELQVYDFEEASGQNRVRWPSFDYSNGANFQPQVNPDYSGLGGSDRTYYRVFRSTISQTNGIITFPGLAEADLASDISLRIKVPSKTVWLDLIVAFNGGTFPVNAPLGSAGIDGEGCRINSGVNSLDINGQIEFSLGAIGTDFSSDFQLIIEIVYANSTVAELLGTGPGLSINW